jgi:hypothetical protein
MRNILLGFILVIAMSSCFNRGTTPSSMFPIKSGEVWEAQITTGNGVVRTNFRLESAPVYDGYASVSAPFATTNGVHRGEGTVLLESNLFSAYFWLSNERFDFVSCQVYYAEGLETITRGYSGFVFEGTSRTLKDGCVLKRM